MKAYDDFILLGQCRIILPMRVSGNTRLVLSKKNNMTFVIRGGSILPEICGDLLQVESIKFTDHESLQVMINALLRYAYFMNIFKIRIYISESRETIDFLKHLGFKEDAPVSSLIYALTYYMR